MILIYFQIRQVYNDFNYKAKSDFDTANKCHLLFGMLFKSGVTQLLDLHHLISLHGSPSLFSSLPLLCSKETNTHKSLCDMLIDFISFSS